MATSNNNDNLEPLDRMRPHVYGMSMVAFALVGIGLAFEIVTGNAPVHFGFVSADDGLSTAQFFLKILAATLPLGAAAWLWRRLRALDDLPKA